MASPKKKLTPGAIAAIDRPGMFGDGDGLYLRVHKAPDGSPGSKSWVLVYHVRGARKEKGLGGFPKVDLAEARARRDAARAVLVPGGNPTFGEVAAKVISDIEIGFSNETHRNQWRNLYKEAKAIWDVPIDLVDTDAVLKCVRPIWERAPTTGDRVRGRIERVLNEARVRKLLRSPGENPARWKGHLALVLPSVRKRPRPRLTIMPYAQVPGFLRTLRESDAASARMLELTVLLATTSNEIRGARCREFDTENALWTIPASRAKRGRDNRVPLTGRSLEIVTVQSRDKDGDELLFPSGRRRRPVSNMAMAMFLRRSGHQFTVHGFQSSFRDWCRSETDFSEDVISGKMRLIDRRRQLLSAWDAYCCDNEIGDRRGWERVERTIAKAKASFARASAPEDWQAIGLLCREAIISLAQAVYDPTVHGSLDDVTPSSTDANRMLDAYVAHAFPGPSSKELRAHARASLSLALNLQHRRTATAQLAALCLEAVDSTTAVIAIIAGRAGARGGGS